MYILGPFLSTFYPPISHFSVITCRRVDRSHFAVEASQRPREIPRGRGGSFCTSITCFCCTWRSNKPRMNTWFTRFWHIFWFSERLILGMYQHYQPLSDLAQICSAHCKKQETTKIPAALRPHIWPETSLAVEQWSKPLWHSIILVGW